MLWNIAMVLWLIGAVAIILAFVSGFYKLDEDEHEDLERKHNEMV